MELFFFYPGGCASCLRACLGAMLLPQSYQYPNLSEGADHVGGRLRGDKKCPFSGVTKSGRVWRQVPESDARSVSVSLCHTAELSQYELGINAVHNQEVVVAGVDRFYIALFHALADSRRFCRM